jgi:hypothetical protein
VKLARDSRYLPWFVLAASLVVCFGWWRWAQTILEPSNTFIAHAKGIPIGNNSDLYPRWLGAREALLNHRDPYSAEVTREIQLGFYGRQLNPRNPSDPKDQAAFAYPLYVIFLLAPTVNLRFRALADWAKRQPPIWSFAGSLLGLILAAEGFRRGGGEDSWRQSEHTRNMPEIHRSCMPCCPGGWQARLRRPWWAFLCCIAGSGAKPLRGRSISAGPWRGLLP